MKIIAYASSTKPNSLMSKAQYDGALPKNREAYDIPLVDPAVLVPLFERIDEAIENYVRHGAVCEFEGRSMIDAGTLLEIGNILGEVAP